MIIIFWFITLYLVILPRVKQTFLEVMSKICRLNLESRNEYKWRKYGDLLSRTLMINDKFLAEEQLLNSDFRLSWKSSLKFKIKLRKSPKWINENHGESIATTFHRP